MRTLGVLIICLALLPQVTLAKQKRSSPVEATAVEKVVKAGPETDGKAFLLELRLKNGRQVDYKFTPADANRVSDGLSAPDKEKYLDVFSIQYGIDRQRQCVILIPQTTQRILDAICFPLTNSDKLVDRLKMDFAQLRPDVEQKRFSPVDGAVAVGKVVKAGQEAGGKAFRLELQLKNGRQVAHQFTPAEADEVSNGLSYPVIKGVEPKKWFVVWSMHTEVDQQRQRVVLFLRSEGRTLDSLGLPLKLQDMIENLEQNFALLRADAEKQGSQPNQPAQQQPAQLSPARQK